LAGHEIDGESLGDIDALEEVTLSSPSPACPIIKHSTTLDEL
jgi:hypothetical protein